MSDVLSALGSSPLLAIIGLIVVLAVVLAPAALSIAGLTGSQIVDLLKETMKFIVELIRVFRNTNSDE